MEAGRPVPLEPFTAPAAPRPGLAEIFWAFLLVGCTAFGGAMFWAQRMLVQRRRWLRPEEFADLLALCQFLPGPNVVNLATVLGEGYRGLPGAAAALAGLLLLPMLIVTAIASLYARFGGLALVHGVFSGVAASAAGLALALAGHVARPAVRQRPGTSVSVMAAAFVAVGLLRWPVAWTLLALAPLSIALAWRRTA
ncbi:MAG TPA: chromate transporter [bacterium]|nr:chromate transporter [bacterium]